jgi:Amidohydrolase family
VIRRIAIVIVALVLAPDPLLAQSAPRLPSGQERGTFRLHKFAQPIGDETYTITSDRTGLVIESHFTFTDRGTQVPLTATLRATRDYTPRSFSISGSTSRFSKVDREVTVNGRRARFRDGQTTSDVALPERFFTISGYAPVAVEMAMLRYWRAHGSPARLPTVPSGEVEIHDRGGEVVTVDGRTIELRRYTIGGLAWGLETVWLDAKGAIAALVTRDAEFDHFEAVREDLEPALSSFITGAARDATEALDAVGRALPGRRAGLLALTGATLIDGTGRAPIVNAAVVVDNGRIVSAGPVASVAIPAGATPVDVSGKFIVPGLWDMHAHYEQVEWGPAYLAAGVTTVRDVGNEFDFIRVVRDMVNSGRGLGPFMLLAGIVDGDGPNALGVTRVNSPQDALDWVKRYHDAGFQQIKIYSSMKPELVPAVTRAAHAAGMTVTGHVPDGMNLYQAVDAGMDQINHIEYLLEPLGPSDFNWSIATQEERTRVQSRIDVHSPEAARLIAFVKEHETVVDDTASLYELLLRPATQRMSEVEPGAANLPPELRDLFDGAPESRAEAAKGAFARILELIGALHQAGVPLVVGTDQAVPAYSVYREMELYVQAGFTPMDALQAATIVPARLMNVDRETGTVEAAKRADLIVLDRNPLEDIRNIRSVHYVVANGVLFDPAPLWKSVGFVPPSTAASAPR